MEKQRKREGQEAKLAHAWESLKAESAVTTQEGEHLRVLFPGLPNSGAGPDFRRAVLSTERGRLVRGDVEVHQTASGWREHGHGDDPRYSKVVLHVVGQDDIGSPTALPSGGRAPVLELFKDDLAESGSVACSGCRLEAGDGGWESTRALLEAQGIARFQAKVRRWRREMDAKGPDQALYEGLLDSLGVGPNRSLFVRLSEQLPWSVLASNDPKQYAAALLGAGGFFCHVRPKEVAAELWEELHHGWRQAGSPVVVAYEEWQRWGSRPRAASWVRLVGAGKLLARWGSQPAEHCVAWAVGLSAAASGLWRKRCVVTGGEAGLGWAPIGEGRADVLVVNVLMPYLAAWGGLTGDASLSRLVQEAYCRYPGLEEDTVVRGLRGRLSLQNMRLSACQQQGLHQVHRWYCARGRQLKCPLRHPFPPKGIKESD